MRTNGTTIRELFAIYTEAILPFALGPSSASTAGNASGNASGNTSGHTSGHTSGNATGDATGDSTGGATGDSTDDNTINAPFAPSSSTCNSMNVFRPNDWQNDWPNDWQNERHDERHDERHGNRHDSRHNFTDAPTRPASPDTPAEVDETILQRVFKSATRTGKSNALILGCGNGSLPNALAPLLPDEILLTVAELHPDQLRHALSGPYMGWYTASHARLLCDTSHWAILLLLIQAGYSPSNTTILINPLLPQNIQRQYRPLQRMFAALRPPKAAAENTASSSQLTVAAILHPDEPDLPDFFRSIPPWVHEMIVVWDSENIPQSYPCAVPLRQAARPLHKDFSAQRNTALAMCRTEWILFLDADERIAPAHWEAIPSFLTTDCSCVAFARQTFLGDEQTCRTGFGLWPDMQIRLFRQHSGVRYTKQVHETLTGLEGQLGLAYGLTIRHYSHLTKTEEQLSEKLEAFNIDGSALRHRLNKEYPTVNSSTLDSLVSRNAPESLLTLPVSGSMADR